MRTVLNNKGTQASATKQHILLVEDDVADAALVQAVLDRSKYPHVLQSLEQGEDAITLVKQQSTVADLILLDITLPGMDGFKTLSLLRANPSTETTPIFMLTASDDMSDVIQAQELGANGYIVKPMLFSLDDLLSAVECVTNIPGAFIKVGNHA